MNCPCCNNQINKLKSNKSNLVSCSRGHKFNLEMNSGTGQRTLHVLSSTDTACKIGDTFNVPDNETF